MPLFKTITQGGQVHIHQLRMLKQILIAGVIVSLIVGIGHFVWNSYHLPLSDWRALSQTSWAKFMIATTSAEQHSKLYQHYIPLRGKPYSRRCLSILNDPFLKEITQEMEQTLKEIAFKSLEWIGWSFLALMSLWFFLGKGHKQAQHQRGNTFLIHTRLAKLLRRKGEASDLHLETLPLIKDKETSHLLLTGTTGSGKTNAFHILLPQIRRRNDRAIIVDVTGTYISRYYNEETDFILNPLDIRSESWHPWADCSLDSHYDVLATSFIPESYHSKDPFWDNASRAVFKTALRKYASQGILDINQLTTFLLSASSKEFEDFFKGTEAATFACKDNEKTTQSIRSVLSSQIEALLQLESTAEPFSIRDWIQHQKKLTCQPKLCNSEGWLFITARPDQRQTLRPLISAWVDTAINALMVLPDQVDTHATRLRPRQCRGEWHDVNHNRRLWFVIDELASLQKLPSLQMGLAEGRKYGGCFLIGFQGKPQLEEIYGRQGAESMLDLFNTKIFFRCTEPSTQTWISKILGDKEEIEPQENISYGANSMRDGVSLSHHTRQKPLIMPTELSQLKDLEAYVKLPGDHPCTKLQMTYQTPAFSQVPAFLLKPEKKRDYGSIEVADEGHVTEISEEEELV
ncbi:MAG: type IV secretion system DNA-binding domain-containing protein [Proteobacteria bacterium]|nr:type IV secretion system DNA-binding domain-containing protein [Pseudomonadota bacterium]